MSIGIGVKLFGKSLEFFIGKTTYTKSFMPAKLSLVSAGGGGFTSLSMEIGTGVSVGRIAAPSFTLFSFHVALRW